MEMSGRLTFPLIVTLISLWTELLLTLNLLLDVKYTGLCRLLFVIVVDYYL